MMKNAMSTMEHKGAAKIASAAVRYSFSQWFSVSALLLCLFVAIFGNYLQPYDPTEFVSYTPFQPPSAEALLGTDFLGRDVLSRLIGGTRLTLLMAIGATLLAHVIGNTLGLFAAVKGGWFDMVLCRIVDVTLSLPKIIVGLVVVAALGSSITVIVIVTGLVYSASVFRIARSLGMDLRQQDFVHAARARGEGTSWIVFGEMLPHVIHPLAADFAIRVSFAILFMSSLSFLGLGVQPPQADWGGLVRENIEGIASGSYASIYAALAIATVSVSLNLLVDASGERSTFSEFQK